MKKGKLKLKFISITVLIIALFIAACESNKFKVDISDIEADIKFHRFDRDLFALNTDSIYNEVPQIYDKYGEFFDLFTHKVINIGGVENKAFPDHLKVFLTNYLNQEVFEFTNNKFKNTKEIEEEITEAFRYYKYYYPKDTLPEIFFYISRFNQSAVTAENIIGIGLDKYLGKNCDYYKKLAIPKYLRYKMRKEMIPVDCMKAWFMTEFMFKPKTVNVLSRAMYKAKMHYFLDAVLPEKHDSLKYGFSTSQIEWCENNEEHMWTYLVENNVLFNEEHLEIKRYTDESPFTTTFNKKSPGKAVVWLCEQIIESYMENNPDVNFRELIAENDYQKILNESAYRP